MKPKMAAALTVNDLTSPQAGAILAERRESVLKFVRSKVRDLDIAEDIVQDVFYQLVRAVDASEVIEDLGAWLYHAARNRVIDWYRKRKPEPMTEMIEQTAVAEHVNGETELARQEIWFTMMDALAELPEKQREVFVMHELEGFSFNEIVEMTGENLNTLLARKRYAVLALRKRMKHLR
jgi:RNA polymerase sigma factor (sigma-70 family)